MGALSPKVKKALSEGAVDFQMGADIDPEDHELVIHDIGWHLVHPVSCTARNTGEREHLTKATKSFRASGEKGREACRHQEIAEEWLQPPAPKGVYRWRTAKGALELKP